MDMRILAEILIWLSIILLARGLVVSSMQWWALNHTKGYSLICQIEMGSQQMHREKWQHGKGVLIDTIFVVVLIALGIFKFGPPSGFELLVYVLSHVFIVEPLYYGFHRFLHVGNWYKKHHFLHHRSLVTSPETSFTFTLAERLSYTVLFSIPLVIASLMGVLSFVGLAIYLVVFDLVNALGHLNHEFAPRWYGNSPLRWLFYTSTFHSQHHSKFRKNYSLFMPIWDKVFGTVEPLTDAIFNQAKDAAPLHRKE